jgi:diguanylate cyclase (GGDEF)-like protein/PAS domain S-box-containing protein
MSNAATTVLVVTGGGAAARSIQRALAAEPGNPYRVGWVTRLSDALARLGSDSFDAVLLDLTLPDGQGNAVFDQVVQAAPGALILVMSATCAGEIADQLVQPGADDLAVDGYADALWLPRALRYVIEHKAAEDALRAGEARFRAMSDASPLGIFVSDAQGGCVYTNSAYQAISGRSLEQTLGTNWSAAIHPEDRARVLAEWGNAADGDKPFHSEARFLRHDESVVWTRLNAAELSNGNTSRGHIHTVEDITERKATEFGLQAGEEALFAEKERAQVTLNSIGDAVLTTDVSGNLTYLNLVAEGMTGWAREEALGRPLPEVFKIIAGTTREIAANPAKRAMEEDRTVGLASDCLLVRRDGFESAIEDSAAPIHDRDGRVAGAVIVFHDVSQSQAMTKRMSHLAQHDFLTGLPNRARLTEMIRLAIGLAHRRGKQVALLYVDLDNFKQINDSLGHAIGDQLLQLVAVRLVESVRSTDTVCRQGGDEFVILLGDIEQPQDAAHVAEKLRAALDVAHHVGGHELHVTLSIGISIYPDDGIDGDAVLQNADTAMYQAKASGRNTSRFFRAEMNTIVVQRLSVESRLRRALVQGELLLHYQPQIDLATGAMIGVEALVRWLDPDLGLVQPAQFVPIAEQCGLIVQTGQWVLREACRQVQSWRASGLRAVPVSVNISAVEFAHRGFLEGVVRILKETGLAPDYLALELTESVLMRDVQSSVSVLESLKALGVQLAIDDFGTGYSSLSYLKRFPIGTLKIDQSFMRDIGTDAEDATIVTAIIAMGRGLHQRVIAEGVETEEQRALLRIGRCDAGQGFLFSRPLPANDLVLLLDSKTDNQPRRWPT